MGRAGLGEITFGSGEGDVAPLIPLSSVRARSRTLPPGVKGGDSRSIVSLVGAWYSFFGDVMPRGAGIGRGFLAGGGAADVTPWPGLPLGMDTGGFGPGGGLAPSDVILAMLICLSLCFIQAGLSFASG